MAEANALSTHPERTLYGPPNASFTPTSLLALHRSGDCRSEAAQRLNTSWSVSAVVNPTIGVNVMPLSPWMLWRWSTLLSKTASGIDVGERVTGLIRRLIKRSVW